MSMSSIGSYQTMKFMQNRNLYQSNKRIMPETDANTFLLKETEPKTLPNTHYKKLKLDSVEQKEDTSTEVFVNPKGERVLMIKTNFGVSYIKIGEETDYLLDDNKTSENIEATLESAYSAYQM